MTKDEAIAHLKTYLPEDSTIWYTRRAKRYYAFFIPMTQEIFELNSYIADILNYRILSRRTESIKFALVIDGYVGPDTVIHQLAEAIHGKGTAYHAREL